MKRRTHAPLIAYAALWAAYFAYGVWLRAQLPLDGEFHGFDYNGLGRLLADHRNIFFFRVRHPLFGIFFAPVSLFGENLARLSIAAYWMYLSAIFSAIVTACVWLVWRICRNVAAGPRQEAVAAACAATFACFGYVRYLAAGPESFPASMLVALATIAWLLREERGGLAARKPARLVAWGGLVLVSGGITITQGLKTILAYLATHKLERREKMLFAAGTAAAACAGAALYAIRLARLGSLSAGATAAVLSVRDSLAACIPSGICWHARLRMLEMFFCEPLIPHSVPFSECTIRAGYSSLWPYTACIAAYAIAVFGAWRLRGTRLLRLLAATFCVDVFIHLVFFWGMDEAQIYCGHWFYALPILAAGAFREKGESL